MTYDVTAPAADSATPATPVPARLVFLWNNFGPMHADRIEAVARRFPQSELHGIEMYDRDVTYDWTGDEAPRFRKTTLFAVAETPGRLRRISRFLCVAWRLRRAHWFMCHYERPEVLAAAILLRLCGAQVFTMGCSKFDDKDRSARGEWLKSFALAPYRGAIGTQERSTDYFRFLGLPRVASPYNTLSVDRMRAQAADVPRPAFADRPWTIVARLVGKKNLSMALSAFALYRAGGGHRALHLCGNGPLERTLKAQADALGIADAVTFHGFVQTAQISRILAGSLALILPSIEEQFGNVVIEAQALDLPVLISDRCGARELLVQDWVNGFSFPHDRPESLAGYMALLDGDEALCARLATGARASAPRGDVAAFAEAVATLVAPETLPEPAV
ncbi:glycosyltransferase [Salipiger aestuarii]|uniref:glycosyltransferase n=1 Tax=Salipiger aestuarii TaxID=568098 RepID=UPI001680CB40|nr:glycosyltransferase [Salipiger aestuarii]